MQDPHEQARRRMEDAVLMGSGHTSARLREAVARRKDVPEELRALVDKIARHAYKVTDEDLSVLKAKYSDDELFELVVAAAVGAAMDRLHAGLRALEDA